MLWSFLTWELIKMSLIISFVLSLVFILFQFFRIDSIVLSLPLQETLPFLILWIFYSLFYFLPTSLFVSSSFVFFELKDTKKLSVIESFGISSYFTHLQILLRCIPVFLFLVFTSFILHEEDISFMRNYLIYKYYLNMVYSIPEKTFSTIGDMTFYVDGRTGNYLSNVFFKKDSVLVVAKSARIEKDTLIFVEGSLLSEEKNKFYLTSFWEYRLSLRKFVSLERNKEKLRRDQKLNLLNSLLSPMLITLGFLLSKKTERATRLYYSVGVLSVFYQFFLLTIKSLL
jgi:lipopolysaccharide export LptBFGC system permease protein LptF